MTAILGALMLAVGSTAAPAFTSLSHAAWQSAHGDSANTGFERVDTAPAQQATRTQPVGSIAPGANPVVGPNGHVYIGNLGGELRAFYGDGTPYWTRKINDGHGGFFAAPVVGADGSIYAVSGVHVTDQRNGERTERNDSFLHKFSPGGGWDFVTPFPEQLSNTSAANTGATTAPPSIWSWNGVEAVIVPVVYQTLYAKDVRLLAFSTSGALLADQLVTEGSSPVVTGGPDFFECLNAFGPIGALLCPFLVASDPGAYIDGDLPEPFFPLPGVAVGPARVGRPPSIMATDALHDKIVYDFWPETGFTEVHRSQHLQRRFTTPPVVLPGGLGTTLTGTLDGYLTRTTYSPRFQDYVELSAIGGLGSLTASPTRLKDGPLVVIDRNGVMTVLSGITVLRHSQLGETSIASAAASCDHFFVATTNHFTTFDAKTLTQVASVSWTGGGLHAPVIGIYGEVYAIASNTLHVFPPPHLFPGTPPSPGCNLAPPVLSQ
jgi:hypothetical protein